MRGRWRSAGGFWYPLKGWRGRKGGRGRYLLLGKLEVDLQGSPWLKEKVGREWNMGEVG